MNENSNENLSNNLLGTNKDNLNKEKIITFFLDFTTGQKFKIHGNQNDSFKYILYKFLKETSKENFKNKIKYALCNANKIDFNKSLLENKIIQNCHVVCFIGNSIKIDNECNKIATGFKYYASITKSGRDQNGFKKINQDRIIIYLNIGNIDGFNLFGILDGHGAHGHLVSDFCRYYFIKKMDEYAEKCKLENKSNPNDIYIELKETKFKFLIDCFNNADLEMLEKKSFDCNLSGTTCNIVIQLNKYLICANVGNSRSILIYDNDTTTNQGICPLSIDHTPDLPGEYQRIIQSGGITNKYKYENGIIDNNTRIFFPGQNLPGIALSRALGDLMAKRCGVIREPDIKVFKLNHNSKYLLIYSDGIWKYLKNEEIRDLGNIYIPKEEIGHFCENLVRKAVINWEEKDIIRDDISVICVFFN